MKRTLPFALPLVLVACGEATPEPKAPEPVVVAPKQESRAPKMQATSELGEIDRKEVVKTFERLRGAFLDCHKKGLERVEYMEGDVKFFVRVGQDGKVRWAYFEESNLGDRETETCLLDTIKNATWPKPEGGEAEVHNAMGFEPPNVRPPVAWSSNKIASVIAKEDGDLAKCKAGVSGKMHVTLYVQPNGKNKGKVQAVGAAIPLKEGANAIACVTEKVMGWDMPSPGSWASKVSFDY